LTLLSLSGLPFSVKKRRYACDDQTAMRCCCAGAHTAVRFGGPAGPTTNKQHDNKASSQQPASNRQTSSQQATNKRYASSGRATKS